MNSAAPWSRIVLTARDPEQAERYRGQTAHVPNCLVLPDADRTVKSGGATEAAIRQTQPDWSTGPVLLIHSGGEATRLPEWSQAGKVFQPYDRHRLFDRIIQDFAGWSAALPSGVLVCCGDIRYACPAPDPAELDLTAVWGHAVSLDVATRHGVLLEDGSRVSSVLQKPERAELLRLGRLTTALVDTGVWWLSAPVCDWFLKSSWSGRCFYADATPQLCRTYRPHLFVDGGAVWEHRGTTQDLAIAA